MGKDAKKKTKSQEKSASNQRSLRLAAVVRQTLYEFVIQEGMKALDAMLEQDRERLCGPRYAKRRPGEPVRWGKTNGRMEMGGRRIVVRKPRVRQNGNEVPLPSWEQFADADPLDDRTFEQLIVGVSTRNYDRSVEELPDELGPHGASKSAASRRFVAKAQKAIEEWQSSDLSELRIAGLMLDGICVGDHTVIVALGLDEAGLKHPLGLWVGATENSHVCGALLDNLIERGLDAHRPYLFVIDGSKALRKAIRDRFGRRALVQRCQEHKRRNVLGHLPRNMHRSVSKAMRDAYKSKSKKMAKRRLLQLASRLGCEYPDAAASLKEGIDETLTFKGMNLPLSLERTLSTTNAIENLNSTIRKVTRNVKRWRNGAMVKRWIGAGIMEAQKGFRRIRGYKGMPLLLQALLKNAEQIDRIDGSEDAA